jgi:hypothetical protein
MLKRLGNVLFGAAIVIAAIWLAVYARTTADWGELAVIGGVIPMLIIATGWALRYIFAGPK